LREETCGRPTAQPREQRERASFRAESSDRAGDDQRRRQADPRVHALPSGIDLKLFTAQRDLVNDKVGAIRFFPDGGSNGGRITLAVGERKYDVDVGSNTMFWMGMVKL